MKQSFVVLAAQRVLFLLLGCVCAGCGSGSNLPGDSGQVSGQATYKGNPIPADCVVVMLHKETGIVATGSTNAQGYFEMSMRDGDDILVGDYQVYITPPGEAEVSDMDTAPEKIPDSWKAIPKKYWTGETSGESFQVQPGQNNYDLVLND